MYIIICAAVVKIFNCSRGSNNLKRGFEFNKRQKRLKAARLGLSAIVTNLNLTVNLSREWRKSRARRIEAGLSKQLRHKYRYIIWGHR